MFLTIHKLENVTFLKRHLKVCITVPMTYKEKYKRDQELFQKLTIKESTLYFEWWQQKEGTGIWGATGRLQTLA